MACSTCHIYVDEKWINLINKPCENEKDMLDNCYEPTEFSKLGCQLKLKPYLHDMIITLPIDSYNNNF